MRLIGPVVWCSVKRKVETITGYFPLSMGLRGFSGWFQVIAAGFAPTSGYSAFLTGDSIGS